MRSLGALALAATAVAGAAAQPFPAGPDALATVLARVGARVEEFYARARTVTSKETVRLQSLEADFRPSGPARQLTFELRVAWEPASDGGPPPEATVLRQLLTVNGRPPRPRDEPECMDPKDVSPDSLSMLLPQNRADYDFKLAGPARVDDRDSLMIDFRSTSTEAPEVVWDDTCVHVTLPGKTRGRIWVDAASYDVLRLDEHLTGMFDFPTSAKVARSVAGPLRMVLERYDSSIRYREVKFDEPEETITLPRLIETTAVCRAASTLRSRTTQQFSDYRRFITGARVVDADAPR